MKLKAKDSGTWRIINNMGKIGIIKCPSCRKDIIKYDMDILGSRKPGDIIASSDFMKIDGSRLDGMFLSMVCPQCIEHLGGVIREAWREAVSRMELHNTEWDEESN